MKQQIEYELQKGKVKNIYLRVYDGKVLVKAPYFVTKHQIEQVLLKKKEWIEKALIKERRRKEVDKQEEKLTQEQLQNFCEKVKEIFEEYRKKIGLSPKKIRIKMLHYAWGSCSSKKSISINTKLALKSHEEIEYVILHELCHLVYMNHSSDFWTLVETYMPDYKKRKKKLKEERI